jgi:hypothetical protein
LNNSIAAGTPANPEDIPPNAAPALSPTVETTMPATTPSSSIVPSTNFSSEAKSPVTARSGASVAQANTPAPTPPVVAVASATPATLLAPSHVRETSGPTMAERLGRLLPDGRTSLVVALVLAGLALLAWVIVPIIPEVRRRLANLPVYRRPVPASGPMMDNGNGEISAQKIMPHRFVGGPRQVSLQLRASEPALRRSVRPLSKPTGAGRPFNVAPVFSPVATFTPAVVEPVIAPVPEPQFDVASPLAETAFDSAVGPVIEQGGAAVEADQVAPAEEVSFPSVAESFADSEPSTWMAPEMPAEQVSEPTIEAEPELEPVGQGEPVPFEIPVFDQEFAAPVFTQEPVAEVIEAETVEVAPAAPAELMADEPVVESVAFSEPEISSFVPPVASTEPSVLQTTIPEIMPEPIQMQNAPVAPVVRTPATGGPSQSSNPMHTAVQLTFSFEIASMQLTPSFKMGALQLRPTSKIVTMRLASSQQPQPAMNLQVTFEISKIQPSGGGLGTVRLSPSQQQRPTVVGSPSFTVGGMQLVSNFESAPVQLTPSQQATVMVTGSFQIATVEFSPSFEIASIVLNSTAKQVAVALPGAGSVEGAPMFEIANLQLGANGEIGMMQLTMLGQGQRR